MNKFWKNSFLKARDLLPQKDLCRPKSKNVNTIQIVFRYRVGLSKQVQITGWAAS